jgi:CAAX prenyl protease-like protein
MTGTRPRRAWVPYVVPFAAFMALLALEQRTPLSPRTLALLRVVIPGILIVALTRRVESLRPTRILASAGVGFLVFLVWLAPDALIPGYRSSWLFENGVVGRVASSVPVEARTDPVFLALRAIRGVLIVPIVEELFWRGWLPRWIDRMDDFTRVPLGTYTALSFWASAALFAMEHGSFWDVGLAAGVGYNWWMRRTRSLGDLFLAHGVTNGCLAVWVLASGQWQYW